jgi:hypothetical protein
MQRVWQFTILFGQLAQLSRYRFGHVATQPSETLNPMTRTGLLLAFPQILDDGVLNICLQRAPQPGFAFRLYP